MVPKFRICPQQLQSMEMSSRYAAILSWTIDIHMLKYILHGLLSCYAFPQSSLLYRRMFNQIGFHLVLNPFVVVSLLQFCLLLHSSHHLQFRFVSQVITLTNAWKSTTTFLKNGDSDEVLSSPHISHGSKMDALRSPISIPILLSMFRPPSLPLISIPSHLLSELPWCTGYD